MNNETTLNSLFNYAIFLQVVNFKSSVVHVGDCVPIASLLCGDVYRPCRAKTHNVLGTCAEGILSSWSVTRTIKVIVSNVQKSFVEFNPSGVNITVAFDRHVSYL